MEKLSEKLKDLKNEILVELIQKVRSKNDIVFLNSVNLTDIPILIYDDGKTYRIVSVSFNTSQFDPHTFEFHCCDSMDTTKDITLTLSEDYISIDELLKLLNSI